MTPAVLPAVSYRDRRGGQLPGLKLPEQRNLILRDGGTGRESNPRLPASGGREPGSCGTVNPGEALLNVVMSDKRKMLTRLGQNGTWSGPGAIYSPGADAVPPAKRRDLTHTATRRERGKPVALPDGQPWPQGTAHRKVRPRGCGYRRGEQAKAVRLAGG
jgi:hypothetical protein